MIRSNLPTLLAERRLSAAKVSKDTGISRTTIGALSSNQAKGVQFDTINTLCRYLGVSPGELFVYAPFDVHTQVLEESVLFTISEKGKKREYSIPMHVDVESRAFGDNPEELIWIPYKAHIYVGILYGEVNDETLDTHQEIKRYFTRMPRSFISDIEAEIRSQVMHDILRGLGEHEQKLFNDEGAMFITDISLVI